MTLPRGADYSLTENATYPFQAEPTQNQARWLEKVLAEEHERDKKHPDRIELPDQ
jgi:hypothetical protein